MFILDRESGVFSWEGYTLRADLTLEAFQQQYPELVVHSQKYSFPAAVYRAFLFPLVQIDGLVWRAGVAFSNRHISTVFMGPAILDELEFMEDGQSPWWQTVFSWLESARTLFREQLGEPSELRHEFRYLVDEDVFLSKGDLERLVNWQYRLPWGGVWLGYDTQNMSAGAGLHYDHFLKITNWQEMLDDHDYRGMQEATYTGKAPDNWQEVRQLIERIRPHFDYKAILPHSNTRGLYFHIKNSGFYVRLELRPHERRKKYRISRDDMRDKIYATDRTLIKSLRKFLEIGNA